MINKIPYIESWNSNEGDSLYFCSICHVQLGQVRGNGKIVFLENCRHYKWRKISKEELQIDDPNAVLHIFTRKYVYVLKLKRK